MEWGALELAVMDTYEDPCKGRWFFASWRSRPGIPAYIEPCGEIYIRFCGGDEESYLLLLYHCDVLERQQFEIFRAGLLTPDVIK